MKKLRPPGPPRRAHLARYPIPCPAVPHRREAASHAPQEERTETLIPRFVLPDDFGQSPVQRSKKTKTLAQRLAAEARQRETVPDLRVDCFTQTLLHPSQRWHPRKKLFVPDVTVQREQALLGRSH